MLITAYTFLEKYSVLLIDPAYQRGRAADSGVRESSVVAFPDSVRETAGGVVSWE
jgi:hypothetical protein